MNSKEIFKKIKKLTESYGYDKEQNYRMRNRCAEIMAESGYIDEALTVYVKKGDEDHNYGFIKDIAAACAFNGDIDKAIKILKKHSLGLQHFIAQAYFEQSNINAAINVLKKMNVKSDSLNGYNTQEEIIKHYISNNDYNSALKIITEIYDSGETESITRKIKWDIVKHMVECEDYDQAWVYLNTIEKDSFTDFRFGYYYIRKLVKMGELERALNAIENFDDVKSKLEALDYVVLPLAIKDINDALRIIEKYIPSKIYKNKSHALKRDRIKTYLIDRLLKTETFDYVIPIIETFETRLWQNVYYVKKLIQQKSITAGDILNHEELPDENAILLFTDELIKRDQWSEAEKFVSVIKDKSKKWVLMRKISASRAKSDPYGAVECTKGIKDIYSKYFTINEIAREFFNKGELYDGLKIMERVKDSQIRFRELSYWIDHYLIKNDINTALKIAEIFPDESYGIINVYTTISLYFIDRNDYDKALEVLDNIRSSSTNRMIEYRIIALKTLAYFMAYKEGRACKRYWINIIMNINYDGYGYQFSHAEGYQLIQKLFPNLQVPQPPLSDKDEE